MEAIDESACIPVAVSGGAWKREVIQRRERRDEQRICTTTEVWIARVRSLSLCCESESQIAFVT